MEPLKTKGFRDSVHGFIELHPLLVKVIDTSQFQRLRNIKQLGGNYHVYPGASHNRFEHSIGTCHLAGKLMRHLQKQQDEKIEQIKEKSRGKIQNNDQDVLKQYQDVKITDKDILCVEMAGLCHDMGHGPFSHVFDQQFMEKIRIKEGTADSTEKKKWKHEQASCDMLNHLKENKLKEEFEHYELMDDEVELIQKMIDTKYEIKSTTTKSYVSRKQFLLEIISNKPTGVDVDKWDYFARDCHHVGTQSTFDHNRFIVLTRVVKCEDGKWHIAVRNKEQRNLYEMFHVRDLLHKRVYQHNVTKAVEEMISDALVAADEHIKFKVARQNEKEEDKEYQISKAKDEMQAYQQLNDSVLDIIRYSNKDGKLKDSVEILDRIEKRDLYRYVHHFQYSTKEYDDKMLEKLEDFCSREHDRDNDLDCIVVRKKFNYGKDDLDPVKNYWFYSKENPDEGRKFEDVASYMLPQIFEEFHIVIYNKKKKSNLNDKQKKELDEKEKTFKKELHEREKTFKEEL